MSIAFSRYLSASMSYAFVRTFLRTNEALISENRSSKVNRNMLITERTFAAIGATLLGGYISPIYLACDLCSLEKTIRNFKSKEDVPRYFTIVDAIFDFKY